MLPPSSPLTLGLLAAASGVSFSLIGVSYRLGQRRGIASTNVAIYLYLAGIIFFALRLKKGDLTDLPAAVWWLGLIGGASQYGVQRLLRAALARGPLSPGWCAVNLAFVPAAIVAAVWFREPISLLCGLGVLVAIAAVVVGSLAASNGNGKPVPQADGTGLTPRQLVVYCVLLFLVLIANAGLFIALNVMARLPHADGVLLDYCSNAFWFIVYLAPGIVLWIDTLIEYRAKAFRPAAIGIGALGALGSIGGVLTLGAAAALPAALAFTLSNILSLLVAGLVSVLFLGEERNAAWWTMMALALAAVAMVSLA